jgi:ERCC4-related helicase
MKFTVLERITLLGVLPASENYVTFKVIGNLKNELSFSDEEIKDFGMKVDGDQVTWNPLKVKEKDVEIGETLNEVITKELKKLDTEKKIDDKNASLYEKFVLSVK